MDTPAWQTDGITITDEGEDLFNRLDTTLFFDTVQDAIDDGEEAGLELLDEGTYRLVFTDPTDTFVTGDVVIKLRKNQSGYQMNQTEFYGRERAPDWLLPYLAPVFGSSDYVVMPRCETDISREQFDKLYEYVSRHDDEITMSREFHHKNVGLYDGVPVVFDYAVDFNLF